MRVVTSIADTRAAIAEARKQGRQIGFVPTMGYLHEGHLALVTTSKQHAPFTVMSIFVNPLQFGPTEDFASYPRDESGDEEKARSSGVDLIFRPTQSEMYGRARQVSVTPGKVADLWEGAMRPGHFAGVLTVVAKLFNIVAPDVAVFGQKDFQQATLISAMVRDLDFPIRVIIHPTMREADGLAMSSRNSYLGPVDRVRAQCLSRALARMQTLFRSGMTDSEKLEEAGRQVLSDESGVVLDYLAVVDGHDLTPVAEARLGNAILIAARVGKTRLLDNTVLGATEPWMANVRQAS